MFETHTPNYTNQTCTWREPYSLFTHAHRVTHSDTDTLLVIFFFPNHHRSWFLPTHLHQFAKKKISAPVPLSPCSPVRCRRACSSIPVAGATNRRRFVATTMPFCLTRIVRSNLSLCAPACPAAVAQRKAAAHQQRREAPEAEGLSRHRLGGKRAHNLRGSRA